MLLLVVTLPACSPMAPQAAAPSDLAIPAQWAGVDTVVGTGAPTTSLAQWWQRFDDPLLADLVSIALRANTSVAIAQAALVQARAQRDVREAGLYPSVGGSASARRARVGESDAANAFNVGFDASWELDVFGARRSALNAAEADAQASAASLDDVRVSIAAEVAVSYIQLRGLQARLAITRDNLATQLETLQITEWRTQAGLDTSLAVEQARTATEQVRAQIPALQTAISQTQHSLAVLTGRSPAALKVLLADARAVPLAPSDLVLSLPAETLRQRPDVRAAERQVGAAWARVSQAQAARYPSFQLSGSLGLQALTIGALGGAGTAVSTLLAGVSVPLFDAGALRSQVRVQQAALDQARLGYQAVVLTALQEVEDALVALSGNRERLLRLTNASVAAASAELLARHRYSSGLIDFQTVLQTQRTLLITQESVVNTQSDLSADHVRLYKSLGGGWQPDGVAPADTQTSSAAPAPATSSVAVRP